MNINQEIIDDFLTSTSKGIFTKDGLSSFGKSKEISKEILDELNKIHGQERLDNINNQKNNEQENKNNIVIDEVTIICERCNNNNAKIGNGGTFGTRSNRNLPVLEIYFTHLCDECNSLCSFEKKHYISVQDSNTEIIPSWVNDMITNKFARYRENKPVKSTSWWS